MRFSRGGSRYGVVERLRIAGSARNQDRLGVLIDTGSRDNVAAGYLLGAVLMVFAACVEWRWGVDAERRPLEAISRPLAFVE
jgi:hypothetical protein